MTNKGWTDNDTFTCFVPAQLMKSTDSKTKETKRWIQGIASTDHKDLQNEVVVPGGIDFSYFLKHGYFNDDHKPGPDAKVGAPTECKVTKNGLWVKGYLFQGENEDSAADKYWKLMNDIERSKADRKVGFSIQGKVLRRNGSTIEKCWIQDIAITTQPVNSATWVEIAKSLANSTVVKDVKKEEDAEKALTAMGSPLAVESLDGKQKDTTTVKALSFEEAVVLVKSQVPTLSDESVTSIVNVAFGMFAKE
jgi:hypothetical protein